MFGFMREDPGPSTADEGTFISTAALSEWFEAMKIKCPQVFLPDETLFGTYTEQHPMGQKLITYFDDDPNKPMVCEVRGSRWNRERTIPGVPSMCAFNKEPMYVVRMRGELSQIHWTSAHEEGGWMRVPTTEISEQNNTSKNRGKPSSEKNGGKSKTSQCLSPEEIIDIARGKNYHYQKGSTKYFSF